jgi:hypothetical protein
VANPTEVKTRWAEYFQEELGKKEEDDNEDEDAGSRTHSNNDEGTNIRRNRADN